MDENEVNEQQHEEEIAVPALGGTAVDVSYDLSAFGQDDFAPAAEASDEKEASGEEANDESEAAKPSEDGDNGEAVVDESERASNAKEGLAIVRANAERYATLKKVEGFETLEPHIEEVVSVINDLRQGDEEAMHTALAKLAPDKAEALYLKILKDRALDFIAIENKMEPSEVATRLAPVKSEHKLTEDELTELELLPETLAEKIKAMASAVASVPAYETRAKESTTKLAELQKQIEIERKTGRDTIFRGTYNEAVDEQIRLAGIGKDITDPVKKQQVLSSARSGLRGIIDNDPAISKAAEEYYKAVHISPDSFDAKMKKRAFEALIPSAMNTLLASFGVPAASATNNGATKKVKATTAPTGSTSTPPSTPPKTPAAPKADRFGPIYSNTAEMLRDIQAGVQRRMAGTT